ncbi:outer membrane protein assembly factor BamB family protein [Haladaptatus sp. NG-WS-4]
MALDLASGEERWRVPIRDLGGSCLSSAVDDAVYITDRDGFLYSLSVPEWLAWRADVTGTVAVDDSVYVAGGQLLALDTETGSKRWSADGGETLSVGDFLYVTNGATVRAYERDGSQCWQTGCDGEIACEPVVTNQRVLVGGDGWVSAFDTRSGEHCWTYDGGCDGLGTVDVLAARDELVFAAVDGRVVAFDSCGEVWSAGADVCALAVDDAVYVGTEENDVVAYDFDGREQ